MTRWYRRGVLLAQQLAREKTMPSEVCARELVLDAVADAPRSGRPLTYTAEQQCAIVGLAVRKPIEYGLPIESWTHRELALTAQREGIATGISRRTVGRILKEADLRPQQVEYWENPVIDDEEAFREAVARICALYRDAPDNLTAAIHTVCLDEKTGMQALERKYPDKPTQPGRPAKLEFEYIRHGTQTLIPAFEVATGTIIHARVGPTRTEADFADVVRQTVNTDPNAEWVFILDQLNTHTSETLVRFVAEAIGFAGTLGKKHRKGILQSLTTRESFLTDPGHRIRFVYTPKHCSWLNQIEIWFGILARKILRHASFVSTDELRERILSFVEYFNDTMAHAFCWTYRGKALKA